MSRNYHSLTIMNKQNEKLKKQLIEISEIVNSFQSEAVQVKVVERLLDVMIDWDRTDADGNELLIKKGKKTKSDEIETEAADASRKKPGATKILNQLLSTTNFFDSSRSISSIADYCKENYDSDFKTSELSGILLKLANEHKLRRERSIENNRFEYISA